MKILLIGSEGMLGQYLDSILQDQTLSALSHKDIDITKFSEVAVTIKKTNPNVVINATAYNDVEGAETKEGMKKANLINGLAVGNLSKIVNKIGGIFVHFSTDYIFNGRNKNGYNEQSIPSPINNYGKSKLLGEQLIQNFIDKFYIIRMSRLFGKLGKSPNSKRSFVDMILNSTKKSIDVIDDEVSSPTYALDASETVKEILLKKLPFGIYHVTNSGHCTWYEFAKNIFDIYAKINPKFVSPEIKPVDATKLQRKAKRPEFSVLVNTKLPLLRYWKIALEDYLKTEFS